MNAAIQIREAGVADGESLRALAAAAATAPQWSAAVWGEILASGAGAERRTLVAEESGVLLGFVVTGLAPGVAEVESIAVLDSAQRRGVGTRLLDAAAQWARARSAGVIELEVRASNAGAIAFYCSLGFAEQGRRAKYYAHPVEDAVLLARAL